jgi:hypothetical protein
MVLAMEAFHFSAMMSKAWSQVISRNSPSLSYLPLVIRSSGLVRRSSPYMIFDRKYPLMQLRPRLTGASGSPCVATTRSFLTPTSTLQPVPQNRQGALSQRLSASPRAAAGSEPVATPAAAAVAAMALLLMKSLRSSFIVSLPRC